MDSKFTQLMRNHQALGDRLTQQSTLFSRELELSVACPVDRERLEYWADSGDAKKLIVAISLRKLSINAPSGVGPVLPMRMVT